MINTQIIEHIIRLGIYSAGVNRETPVSIMLIANPESGKTAILTKFSDVPSVKFTTDLNTNMFVDFCYEYQANIKKTIVVGDFLRITSKKHSAQKNILTILNACMEEGYTGKLPMGQYIEKKITANLITSITQDEVSDKRHKWSQLGFMSRLLPITYAYTGETAERIMQYIKDRVYHKDEPYKFEVPKEKVDIMLPLNFADDLEIIRAEVLDKLKETNLYGFRLQRQFQVLAMANALSSGRNIVTKDDVDMIREISKFINFDYTRI